MMKTMKMTKMMTMIGGNNMTTKNKSARTSIIIYCLDDDTRYIFVSKTPYEAMEAMLYYLNLLKKDTKAAICKTETNKHLYLEHDGRTYCTRL